jgi:formate dehydrogenase subunit delta
MRTALYAHLDASGGEGLSEFALQVLRDSREQIEPQAVTV